MSSTSKISSWKDSVLFTPGPLTTSQTVKLAMLKDFGARDGDFIDVIRDISQRLITQVAGLAPDVFTTILMQGCGSMGVESVISSVIPPFGKLLVINNGAYGERMYKTAKYLNIDTIELKYEEDQLPDIDEIDQCFIEHDGLTHIIMVHCETTSGIMNPIDQVGQIAQKHSVSFIVDAMSSFGAVDIDFDACCIDYLVSSANKCLEGVPGFSFIIARSEPFLKTQGYARSLCFDLYDQHKDLSQHGYFRYTPATHTLLAFQQALNELDQEGGVTARSERYKNNHQVLLEGMQALGFQSVVNPENQGYIITSFYYPEDPGFNFDTFYEALHKRGYVIYPGKLTHTECFRVANIGRIFESDIKDLLLAMKQVLADMGVSLSQTSVSNNNIV